MASERMIIVYETRKAAMKNLMVGEHTHETKLGFANIPDEDIHNYEGAIPCEWCGDENADRVLTDIGFICHQCIHGIRSRGEKVIELE